MKKKKNRLGLIKRFLPYYKKYKWIMLADLFCAGLTTVCELVLPMIVRTITEAATENLAALTVDLILRCGLFYVVLRVIDTAANYYMTSVGHIMGTKIENDMRHDLFAHLQKLSFSYYDNTKVGTLMSRITNDLFDVTEFAHHCPEEFFIAGVKIVCAFIILCTMNLWLTLIIFSLIPFMILALLYFRARMRDNFAASRKQIGELNSQIEDSLLGIRVVKSYAKEDVEQEKFDRGNRDFLTLKTQRYRIMAQFHSATRLFDGIMYILVVIAGGLFLLDKIGQVVERTAVVVQFALQAVRLVPQVRHLFEHGGRFHKQLGLGLYGAACTQAAFLFVGQGQAILGMKPLFVTEKIRRRAVQVIYGPLNLGEVAVQFGPVFQNVVQQTMIDGRRRKLGQEKQKAHHQQELQERKPAEHQRRHVEGHGPGGILKVYSGLCKIHGAKDRKMRAYKTPLGRFFRFP